MLEAKEILSMIYSGYLANATVTVSQGLREDLKLSTNSKLLGEHSVIMNSHDPQANWGSKGQPLSY